MAGMVENSGGEKAEACSPDAAKRNPGCQSSMRFPDYASLHPGYEHLFLDKKSYSKHHANGEQYQQVFRVQHAVQHAGRVMTRVCMYSR